MSAMSLGRPACKMMPMSKRPVRQRILAFCRLALSRALLLIHFVKSDPFTLLDPMGGLMTVAGSDSEILASLNSNDAFSLDTAARVRPLSSLSTWPFAHHAGGCGER